MQAINYQLEYVYNSRLARSMLVQLQHKQTCKTCASKSYKWTTDWMLQFDPTLVKPQGSFEDAFTIEQTDRAMCATCKSIQPCNKKQSVTHLGKLVFVNVRPVKGAKMFDQSLTLCNRQFTLCNVLLCIMDNESDARWLVMTRDPDQNWLKHGVDQTSQLSSSEAKKLVDQHGLVLAFIEQNKPLKETIATNQENGTAEVLPDDTDDHFPEVPEQDDIVATTETTDDIVLTSPSKTSKPDSEDED